MPQMPVVRSVTSIAHYSFCELHSVCDALKKTFPMRTLLESIDTGVIHVVPLFLVFSDIPNGLYSNGFGGFCLFWFAWLFHEIEMTDCKYLQFQRVPLTRIQ